LARRSGNSGAARNSLALSSRQELDDDGFIEYLERLSSSIPFRSRNFRVTTDASSGKSPQ
jgi:hypothetical protein